MMTPKEEKAIDFLARAMFAYYNDPASAMFDFKREDIKRACVFLGLDDNDMKSAANKAQDISPRDIYGFTDAFKTAVIPNCVLF